MILGFWGYISAAVAIAISLVIIGMALAIVRALFDGTIDLKYLLSEPASPGPQAQAQANAIPPEPLAGAAAGDIVAKTPEEPKASLSRFQLLIFTFVIAGVYLILCLESGTFVEIPQNVVLLLGVSGTTYAASKGIKTAGDTRPPQSQPAPMPQQAPPQQNPQPPAGV